MTKVIGLQASDTPCDVLDLGRGKAYHCTLLHDAPT